MRKKALFERMILDGFDLDNLCNNVVLKIGSAD